MMSDFDKDYYERGIELGISGYTNYQWLPELTIPMCFRMIEYLGITKNDRILDFGCAFGYVVKAFRLLHRECYGYDISDYALSQVPQDVIQYVTNNLKILSQQLSAKGIYKTYQFDWTIAKDVFEHISYNDIDLTLTDLNRITRHLFAIIPLGKNAFYNVPIYDNDITHVITESLKWWENRFQENGFIVKEACYEVKYLKQNYASYKRGNGFFTLSNIQ